MTALEVAAASGRDDVHELLSRHIAASHVSMWYDYDNYVLHVRIFQG